MPTPTRRIARRLTALGLVVGLVAVLVSTSMASGTTPGDLRNPSLDSSSTNILGDGPQGVAFETMVDTPASAVGILSSFRDGATLTAEIRDITGLTSDEAVRAPAIATATATMPSSGSLEFRDVPLPVGFVFQGGKRYDVRFTVAGGWGIDANWIEYQVFDEPGLIHDDGFDADPFRVLDGGCSFDAGKYSYGGCFILPAVHIVVGGDQRPPTVVVRIDDSDRPDGAFYNIASSGEDGVRLDVSAEDESGVASLECTDADGTVLANTTASAASFDLRDGDHAVSCTAVDAAGNPGRTAHPTELHIDQTPPDLAPAVVPNPVREGQPAQASAHASDVRGINDWACDTVRTDVVGRHRVACSATDGAGNDATAEAEYDVDYAFDGFFSPVRMNETNRAKAGSSVPLKFSIGEYDGLDILASGSPSVQLCNDGSVTTPAVGKLTYDTDAGQYVYVWKTDRAWAGTCRQITVRLDDGSAKSVSFGMT